jgi:hypothetical protein
MSGGLVAVLRQITVQDQEEAWSKVENYLDRLRSSPPSSSDPCWNNPDANRVKAFYRLKQGNERISSVLGELKDRETRARILRYLVKKVDKVPEDITEIIKQLSSRDLKLFLSYLPDQCTEWNQAIYKETQTRWKQWEPGRGDDSAGAAMAAMVALLRRFWSQKPTLAALVENRPRTEYFQFPWVRIEFMRLLVEAAQREEEAKNTPRLGLFLQMMNHFPQLLPELFAKGYCVFPYGSEPEKDFRAFAILLDSLVHPPSIPLRESLGHLSQRLRPVADGNVWLGLISALIDFHYCISEHAGEDWRGWRQQGLAALRRLAERSFALMALELPAEALVEGLRTLLLPQSVPADQETLEDRELWIERARRRLDELRKLTTIASHHPWYGHLNGLLERTRTAIGELLTSERAYILHQVRLRLHLQSCRLEEGHRLRLRFKTEPEGSRQLDGVSIVFDARDEQGLSPRGQLDKRIDVLLYPEKFPTEEFELYGYVRPDQKTVCIRVSLQDETGYESIERWCFDIPESSLFIKKVGRFTLQAALPKLYKEFLDTVFKSRWQVTLVVFDPDLGQEAFIEDWRRRYPGWQVDLDAALRDTGRGRYYGARALDLSLIQEVIDQAIQQAHSQGGKQPSIFLVGPVNELIQRLLDGEALGVLEAWWSSLREWAGCRQPPAWCSWFLRSTLAGCTL